MKGEVFIRKGNFEDIENILLIYDSPRKYMRANNNLFQWVNGYPNAEDIKIDIKNGNSYVGTDKEGNILMTFAFIKGDDPTYKIIKYGQWLNDEPYGTIHRIASNGKMRGVLNIACNYCFKEVDNIRIDTHKDNKPMLKALNDLGFRKCGEIICGDGTPRIAFQKTIKTVT